MKSQLKTRLQIQTGKYKYANTTRKCCRNIVFDKRCLYVPLCGKIIRIAHFKLNTKTNTVKEKHTYCSKIGVQIRVEKNYKYKQCKQIVWWQGISFTAWAPSLILLCSNFSLHPQHLYPVLVFSSHHRSKLQIVCTQRTRRYQERHLLRYFECSGSDTPVNI